MKKLVFRGLAAWLLVALCSAAAWARPAVLIPGGQTVGIKLYSQGLVVTGFDQKSAAKAAGLKKGDIIVMCTDGLTNMVEDEEIFHIVQGARDVVEAAETLVAAAKENGGTDNIGIVLAKPDFGEVSIC